MANGVKRAMLRLTNLYKAFDKKQTVLKGVSLDLAPGRAVCIAGKNASGKTTLLKLACGVLTPDAGAVSCNGRIAFVPQEPAILPELTVQDNLALWYAAQNLSGPSFVPGSPEELLGLLPYRKKRSGALSGGMKKRLSIAEALVGSPAYLLLDEPFAALDAEAAQILLSLLLRLKGEGVGILFSAHEPEQISAVADEIVLLHRGTLSETLALDTIPEGQRPAYVLRLLFGTETFVCQ